MDPSLLTESTGTQSVVIAPYVLLAKCAREPYQSGEAGHTGVCSAAHPTQKTDAGYP